MHWRNGLKFRSSSERTDNLFCCKSSKDDRNDSEVLNNFNLDDINTFFASILTSGGADLGNLSPPVDINSTFSFTPIDKKLFLSAFMQNKSNAVDHHDGIPLKFFKLIIEFIAQHVVIQMIGIKL